MNPSPAGLPQANLPPGWQLAMDSLGRPFFYNPYTQQTSWTTPTASSSPVQTPAAPAAASKTTLPAGWEESVDTQGRVYYIDHTTKRTSWVPPTLSSTPPTQNAAYGSPPTHMANAMHMNMMNMMNSSMMNNMSTMSYPSLSSDPVMHAPPPPPPSSAPSHYEPVFVPQQDPAPSRVSVSVPVSAPPDPSLSALAQSKALWDTEKVHETCTGCASLFTFTNRHHHCRCCQREFCNACSTKRAPVPQFDLKTAVRVCDPCFNHLNERKDNACLARLVPYLTMDNANLKLQALSEALDIVTRDEHRGIMDDILPTNILIPILEILSKSGNTHVPNSNMLSSEVIGTNLQLVSVAARFVGKVTTHAPIREYEKIRSRETVASLANILSSSQPYEEVVIVDTLKALINLSKVDSLQGILSHEVVPSAVMCLDSPSESVQVWAAQCLQELCADETARQHIADGQGVSVLVPLLSSKNEKLVLCVATILRLLCSQERTRDLIYKAGGVGFIIGLLSSREHAIQVRALDILSELSLLDRACQVIANGEEGVGSIVALLRSPHEKIQEEALTITTNLLSNRDSKAGVISAFMVPEYMKSLVNLFQAKGTILHLALTLGDALIDNSESIKDSFREADGVNPLLSLAAGRKGKHLQALQMLTKLAQDNGANCNTILEVGGVSVLVDLITQPPPTDEAAGEVHHLDVQLYAVLALGSLSSSPIVISEFPSVENGAGVRALVNLLQPSQDDTAKEAAALALSKLALNEQCAQLVFSLGGVGYASAMLSSPREPLQREALSLLSKLAAQSNRVRRSIGETSGCIALMVGVLSRASSMEVKSAAITCLYEVCKDTPSNREAAFNNGCTAPLLSLIPEFAGSHEIQGRIVGLIASFSADSDRFRAAIRDTRGIHALVELIFTAPTLPEPAQDGSVPELVPILVSAIITLANFALGGADGGRKEMDAAEIVNSGGVLALVPQLSSAHAPLQEYSALALANLALVSLECRLAILAAGALPAGVPLLTSPVESVATQGLFLVSTLSQPLPPPHPSMASPAPEDPSQAFLSAGGMPPLVGLLTAHPSQAVRNQAIALLINLLGGPSVVAGANAGPNPSGDLVWKEYVRVGGVAGLIALVGSDVPLAQYKGATTLARVASENQACRQSIIEGTGVIALIALLPSPDMAACCAAVGAIAQLSREASCSTLLVEHSALDHLVKIGSAAEQGVFPAEVKAQVGEIFANMSVVPACRAALSSAGAIPRLIDLLFSSSSGNAAASSSITNAAKAIGLLAADTATAQSVFDQGGLFALLPLLTPPHSYGTRCSAALALANLCRHYPPSRQTFLSTTSEMPDTPATTANRLAHSSTNVLMSPTFSATAPKPTTILANSPLGSIIGIITRGGDDTSLDIRVIMLELLETLSHEPEFASQIEKSGGLPILVGLVNTYFDAPPTPLASPALSALSSPDSSASSSTTPSSRTTSPLAIVLSILSNISKNHQTRATLLQSGLLNLISRVITPTPQPSLLVQLDEFAIDEKDTDVSDAPASGSSSLTESGEVRQKVTKKIRAQERKEVESRAVGIVCMLCYVEEGRQGVRDVGLIKPILRMMTRSFKNFEPDQDGASEAASALPVVTSKAMSLLALTEGNREAIRELGGMDAFASVLALYTSNTNLRASNHPSPVNIIAALDNLSFNEKALEQMFSSNIISSVIGLLSSPVLVGDEESQARILRFVRNLSSSTVGSEKILQLLTSSHSLRSLVSVMYTAQGDSVYVAGLDLLVNLCRSDKFRRVMSEAVEADRESFGKLLAHCKERGVALATELTEALGM
eukprot:TRINITY_DN2152_c0_g1_i5.p1 TRINITY_DN2152_c0_g1~~TRINITY_DN2152_c0_g1_i5.p1  ORF type:complete len:1807 (-),score=472.19 TRINITY_DN2152_c0_g1_i5:1494-6914(-)